MSYRRVFSSDPLTRTRQVFHSEEPGQYIIETQQDVTDLVELNKAQYNAFSHKSVQKFKGERFHCYARVPLALLFDPATGRMKDDDELKRWLNSNEALAFRTMPGVL